MHLLRALLVASAALSLGCNFIFNPDGDGILRCDNADDCEVPLAAALEDERGQPACGAGGQAAGDFTQSADNKVCSVIDKEDVSCDPNKVGAETPFGLLYAEASAQTGLYKACISDQKGTLGCPPTSSGKCDSGLEVRMYNANTGDKDNPSPEAREICVPAGSIGVEPNPALLAWDVRDQHCRSYFCDESFVCARGNGGSSGFRCVRCDPKEVYGDGGCGELLIQGKASSVYDDDGTCEEKASDGKTHFGPIPVLAPTCFDGAMNGDETGIDCGGSCPSACP